MDTPTRSTKRLKRRAEGRAGGDMHLGWFGEITRLWRSVERRRKLTRNRFKAFIYTSSAPLGSRAITDLEDAVHEVQ